MKRLIAIFLALLLITASATAAAISINHYSELDTFALGEPLRPDDGKYVDYAKEVKFDLEKDPELKTMGMFWASFDSEGRLIETPVDSEEAAKIVDPNKPTMIAIHGMMSDGHYAYEKYYIGSYELEWETFGVNSNTAKDLPNAFNMAYLWINQGWNFAFYHYEKFASEGASFGDIEQKIWSWVDSDEEDILGNEVRYKKRDGTFVYNPISYSVGEHFAAEYIRAMNRLPKSMGDQEIRICAHSMGGQVAAAGLFLLTELARKEVGQLDPKLIPDRYALMDTFFSNYLPNKDKTIWTNLLSQPHIENSLIRWSGKPHINGTTGHTIALILEILYKKGMLLEYYTEPASVLYNLLPDEISKPLHTYCSVVIIKPFWEDAQPGYKRAQSHNAVREWYLCSKNTNLPKLSGDKNKNIPSAAMSGKELRKHIGKKYVQAKGEETTLTNDDFFSLETT